MPATLQSLTALRQRVRRAAIAATKEPLLECVLAGGTVRDMLCGKPVKDYDFFFHQPSGPDDLADPITKNEFKDMTRAIAKQVFHHGADASISFNDFETDGEYEVSLLSAVATIHGWPDVQIILLPVPVAEHIPTFGLGLSQAWIGEGGVRTTRAFQRDLAQKTLTIIHSPKTTREKVIAYARRVAAKYPNYKPIGFTREEMK